MDADKVVPDSWRIKNSNDFVTRIPSLLGYQHIGVEVCVFHFAGKQCVYGCHKACAPS